MKYLKPMVWSSIAVLLLSTRVVLICSGCQRSGIQPSFARSSGGTHRRRHTRRWPKCFCPVRLGAGSQRIYDQRAALALLVHFQPNLPAD